MSLTDEPRTDAKTPWILTLKMVFLGLFIFGPLALPLVWLTPKMSVAKKIFLTALTLFLAALMWKFSLEMFRLLTQRLDELKNMGLQ